MKYIVSLFLCGKAESGTTHSHKSRYKYRKNARNFYPLTITANIEMSNSNLLSSLIEGERPRRKSKINRTQRVNIQKEVAAACNRRFSRFLPV